MVVCQQETTKITELIDVLCAVDYHIYQDPSSRLTCCPDKTPSATPLSTPKLTGESQFCIPENQSCEFIPIKAECCSDLSCKPDQNETLRCFSSQTTPIEPTPTSLACNKEVLSFSLETPYGNNNFRYVSYKCFDGFSGKEDGEKEVALWFNKDELFNYELAGEKFMYKI